MSVEEIHLALLALQADYLAYPMLVMLGYFALFTSLTACCLPGAALLNLLSGLSSLPTRTFFWASALGALAALGLLPLLALAWRKKRSCGGC